jgi:hypothetical protein
MKSRFASLAFLLISMAALAADPADEETITVAPEIIVTAQPPAAATAKPPDAASPTETPETAEAITVTAEAPATVTTKAPEIASPEKTPEPAAAISVTAPTAPVEPANSTTEIILAPTSPIVAAAVIPESDSSGPGRHVSVLLIVGAGAAAFLLVVCWSERCPQCHKWFGEEETSREVVDKHYGFRTVSHRDMHRASNGGVLKTVDRQVQERYVTLTYQMHYRCRGCNREWTAEKTTTTSED